MKNKKVLIIAFIIIDVLVLGFAGYKLLFSNLITNDSDNNINDFDDENSKEKYTLNVYKSENEYYNEKSDLCNEY